jgi:hypothetical protein
MRPDRARSRRCGRGIDVEVAPTPEAVARYAELDPQMTAAALHLTC